MTNETDGDRSGKPSNEPSDEASVAPAGGTKNSTQSRSTAAPLDPPAPMSSFSTKFATKQMTKQGSEQTRLFSGGRQTRRPQSKFQLRSQRLLSAVLLATLMTVLMVYLMNWLPAIWATILRFGLSRVGIHAELLVTAKPIYAYWEITQLAIKMPLAPISSIALWTHSIAIFVLSAIGLIITPQMLPVAHLLRILCVVHAIGLLIFTLTGVPDASTISHTLALYNFTLVLLFLTPTLLAMCFYLFEESWRTRFLGSLLILAYLIVVLPFKLLVHVWLIKFMTPLAMPTLYLLFGPALDVVLLAGLYAYVMTWDGRPRLWTRNAKPVESVSTNMGNAVG